MSVTPPSGPTSPTPHTVLAERYRLEKRLAQGGMAEVWRGTDLSLSRDVAIKLLKPSLAADPVVAERFRREAVAVARLSHPNIVAVFDAIEETFGSSQRQAVIMQLINGKSLRQLLDEQKRLSPDLTMHIGSCVASALECAHEANLVHRDVKPGNILVTPDGRVLLTDFGIAKGVAGTADDDLTSPNVMMGTAKYLSPEQVRGKKLDGRADLYSLGLVLYECLAGRVPFLGETDTETALARLNRDPTDLHRLRPTLPSGLAELIHKLLARKPDHRFATGGEVRAELQRIASAPPTDYTLDASLPIAAGATPPGGLRGRLSRTSPLQPGGSLARGTANLAVTGTGTVPPTAVGKHVAEALNRTGATTRPDGALSGRDSRSDTRGGRPGGTITRLEPRRDPTPRAAQRARQQPNRSNDSHSRAHLLIVGVLVAAVAVGALLWITRTNKPGSQAPVVTSSATTAEPAATDAPADTSGAVAPAAEPVGATGIAAVSVFDPDGDGKEMNQLAPNAIDGDPATHWTTVCYASRYMGGKKGVGLVVDLGSSRTGTLTAAVASAPFQVRVWTSNAATAPTTFDEWGSPLRAVAGTAPRTVTAKVTAPARWALVAFVELGRNSSCSSMPYRGAIADIAFH